MTIHGQTYSGGLIAESLQLGAKLEACPLTVSRFFRSRAGNREAGQPELWTLIEFEVAVEHVEQLATALAHVLGREGGWYCDFHSEDEVIVVFADRVFRYPRW